MEQQVAAHPIDPDPPQKVFDPEYTDLVKLTTAHWFRPRRQLPSQVATTLCFITRESPWVSHHPCAFHGLMVRSYITSLLLSNLV